MDTATLQDVVRTELVGAIRADHGRDGFPKFHERMGAIAEGIRLALVFLAHDYEDGPDVAARAADRCASAISAHRQS